MISDFIASNGLNAEVLNFPSAVSLNKALFAAKLDISSYCKSHVFVNSRMDFFAVVSVANEKISIIDAEDLFDENLEEVDSGEVMKLTGFEKDFFPPLSVIGLKVEFTKQAAKQKKLFFGISPTEYLVIDVASIKKAQEISDSFFA